MRDGVKYAEKLAEKPEESSMPQTNNTQKTKFSITGDSLEHSSHLYLLITSNTPAIMITTAITESNIVERMTGLDIFNCKRRLAKPPFQWSTPMSAANTCKK